MSWFRPQRIFLSYARHDRERVAAVKMLLELSGAVVFVDTEIEAGDRWRVRIERALLRADVLCVFWSHHAAGSRWVEHEWTTFLRRRPRRRCVPLLADDTPLPPELGERQAPPEMLKLTRAVLDLQEERARQGLEVNAADVYASAQDSVNGAQPRAVLAVALRSNPLPPWFRLFLAVAAISAVSPVVGVAGIAVRSCYHGRIVELDAMAVDAVLEDDAQVANDGRSVASAIGDAREDVDGGQDASVDSDGLSMMKGFVERACACLSHLCIHLVFDDFEVATYTNSSLRRIIYRDGDSVGFRHRWFPIYGCDEPGLTHAAARACEELTACHRRALRGDE